MENSTMNKRSATSYSKIQTKQNITKKRPTTTKLDIEKMFQESIELTQVFKKLQSQNRILRAKYQKVQGVKFNRQNLISVVQKIVDEKAKDISKNPSNQSSWLVHKLNNKIYQLNSKIDHKEKMIQELQMSKQSQIIRERESEIQSLNQILQWTKTQAKPNHKNPKVQSRRSQYQNQIKQIVWIQQEIKAKQDELIQAEKIYDEEARDVKKIMMQLSQKKAELNQIKQLQEQYIKAQEEYKQQKKKKQQRLLGNKNYIDELIQTRNQQAKKLQELKQKFSKVEQEQEVVIGQLQKRLQVLQREYEDKNKVKQELTFRVVQQPINQNKQRWVKKVNFQQVKNIVKNLNFNISLKRVPKEDALKRFSKENQQQYSIKEVIQILKEFPFKIGNQTQAMLLARYLVQDSGDAYFFQDLQTSQVCPIIKSVLSKLIGYVKIFDYEEEKVLLEKTGTLMAKFHSLVQQNIQAKEGCHKKVTKEILQEGIIATQLQLNSQEINFIVLYLFSWSLKLDELELNRLSCLKQKGIKWFDPSQKIAQI